MDELRRAATDVLRTDDSTPPSLARERLDALRAALAARSEPDPNTLSVGQVAAFLGVPARSEPGAEGLREALDALSMKSAVDRHGTVADQHIAMGIDLAVHEMRQALAATPPADSPRSEAGLDVERLARALETVEQDIVKRVEADPSGYQPFTHRKWAEALIAALSQASDDREAG